MPEYLTPGVYIEEIEIGAKPIEGVSTSTAAMIGLTERGPTDPRLVTSFPEYKRLFGAFFGDTQFMPYAVDGFFGNGGKRCYIARIVDKENAATATITVGSVIINAVGEGVWGNRVLFRVKAASTEKNGFRLQVHYWSGAVPENVVDPLPSTAAEIESTKAALRSQPAPQLSEDFDDLVLDEASPNFIEKRVANGLSNLIELKRVPGGTAVPPPGDLTPLADGDDGDDPDLDVY
jgi:hypothetical protein